jgi:hypothetical protein
VVLEEQEEVYIPPVSIPFTAASEIVLSTTFAASLTTSTGLLRAMGEVENRRAWRANAVRNMVMICGEKFVECSCCSFGRGTIGDSQVN